MSEIILTIDGIDPLELYGENNSKLNLLKRAYSDVQITSRGNQVKIKGEKKGTENVKLKLEIMVRMIQDKHDFSTQVVEDLLASDHAADNKISQHSAGGVIVYCENGSPIKAKTKNQKLLVECSEMNDIVFAVGPAGTRPLLSGEQKQSSYESVYGAYLELQRAITHDGWKLIAYPKAKVLRLYHLAEDPLEMSDIAANPEHASMKKSLYERLVKLSAEMGDKVDLRSSFTN